MGEPARDHGSRPRGAVDLNSLDGADARALPAHRHTGAAA